MAAVAPVDAAGSSAFARKEYDVTNTIANVAACCLTSQTLILEPEEAVLETKCVPCIHSSKRMPYGELGSVDKTVACGCCHSFSSNLSPGTAEAPVSQLIGAVVACR